MQESNRQRSHTDPETWKGNPFIVDDFKDLELFFSKGVSVIDISSLCTDLLLSLYTTADLKKQSCGVKYGGGTEQQPEPLLRQMVDFRLAETPIDNEVWIREKVSDMSLVLYLESVDVRQSCNAALIVPCIALGNMPQKAGLQYVGNLLSNSIHPSAPGSEKTFGCSFITGNNYTQNPPHPFD